MAFMMKKKKYKFQVEVSLDELVEVPFVSAVLFAKVRLLDGGNFQDYSTREEVKDHKVKWSAHFEFPCKMSANASTGVLEPCNLRISVRKEIKGGRSYLKHGFCDINLAELAGAGQVARRYLLEGYDNRHRSDNSMLKVTISMNMLSGDILFKVPSPTTKLPTSVGTAEEAVIIPEGRTPDDFSGGSLAGSVASGSSGFGSLPKKRPALFNSELLASNSTEESEIPVGEEGPTLPSIINTPVPTASTPDMLGHSRNSSSTSQMSKASGYSTQHSRQSSSGDSVGHIRSPSWPVWAPTPLTPPFSPPSPSMTLMDPKRNKFWQIEYTNKINRIPKVPATTEEESSTVVLCNSNVSINSNELYVTPDGTFGSDTKDILLEQVQYDLRKSQSCTVVEKRGMTTINENHRSTSVVEIQNHLEIPTKSILQNIALRSDTFINHILTPLTKRRAFSARGENGVNHSTPTRFSLDNDVFKMPGSPIKRQPSPISSSNSPIPTHKAISLGSLRSSSPITINKRGVHAQPNDRVMSHSHRKLYDSGSGGGKLSPVPSTAATSPPDDIISNTDIIPAVQQRRPSGAGNVHRNPSAGSLALSETGSLDRAKSALERRKRTQEIIDLGTLSSGGSQVSEHVENTRVNPENLIAEIIKSTNLEPEDDAAETSGLQLFIAKDGTAALGSHEVKSQISSGVQVFKQVVIEEKR